MTGHEGRSANAFALTIEKPLAELLEHIASHSSETGDSLADLALILGLCDVVNKASLPCVSLHMIEFLENHGPKYGIRAGDWRAMHN